MLMGTRVSIIIQNHLSITLWSTIIAKYGERTKNFDPLSIHGNYCHKLIRIANQLSTKIDRESDREREGGKERKRVRKRAGGEKENGGRGERKRERDTKGRERETKGRERETERNRERK